MMDNDDSKGRSKGGTHKVGYGRPPLHSRFQPGMSGNPKGRSKRSKGRNLLEDLQQVYLQDISVADGGSKRRMSAVVVLFEKLLRDALKGNAKATALAVKLAGDLGVMHIRIKPEPDFSVLTPEERELLRQVGPIYQKLRESSS
jgi:hypothetical protein